MKTEITQLLKTKSHNFNGRIINGINARLLHKALDVGRDYPTWIRNRIKQGKFIEHLDYLDFPKTGENPLGGRPSKEIIILGKYAVF